MKKKLLINIFSLLLFFVLVAIFIWPKVSETLESREKQTALNEKITDLDNKTERIGLLGQKLEKNIEDQKAVSEYLPLARGDEYLINYLENIASAEGVSLKDVGIKKKEALIAASAPLAVDLESNTASSPGGLETLPAVASPTPVFETVDFSFFASYEKMADLLRKFDGLKRFNRISSLKIVKTYPEGNKKDAGLNFLQVKLGLDFNHLKKITSQAEISGNLLSKDNFDQETLTKIKNKAINGANNPDGNTDGRNNPFIP